ncbi:MAG: hypothetical protein LBT51_09145 [Fusobacteriaceae bacterium]|jgi:hypothetical protein|nr:hypothetical protein [Fusobacteriaceae bacterium]
MKTQFKLIILNIIIASAVTFGEMTTTPEQFLSGLVKPNIKRETTNLDVHVFEEYIDDKGSSAIRRIFFEESEQAKELIEYKFSIITQIHEYLEFGGINDNVSEPFRDFKTYFRLEELHEIRMVDGFRQYTAIISIVYENKTIPGGLLTEPFIVHFTSFDNGNKILVQDYITKQVLGSAKLKLWENVQILKDQL